MFVCPECGGSTLSIRASLELPSDARSDEISVQIVECSACGFRGAALYEESRRGAMDSETWNHIGYRLPADRAAALMSLMQTCRSPALASCTCAAHRQVDQRRDDEFQGLQQWGVTGEFPLQRVT